MELKRNVLKGFEPQVPRASNLKRLHTSFATIRCSSNTTSRVKYNFRLTLSYDQSIHNNLTRKLLSNVDRRDSLLHHAELARI
jgi:hypothetical protein